MLSLIILVVLAGLGGSMDLAPVATQEPSYSVFKHIVQSLYYFHTGKVQALLLRDLPDEFFATFAPHERRMVKIIREFHERSLVTILPASFDDIPLERVIEIGLLDNELLGESFKLHVQSTDLFVHCPNIVKYRPTATDGHDLYEQFELIYGTANNLTQQIKTHLDDGSIKNIFISGHLGGTAVAQLAAISLHYDPDLGQGIKVYSVGFGEHLVFSRKMIRKLDKISGFDKKRHLVFAGFERYFSPNFGSRDRFGTVLDIELESMFDGRQTLNEYLEEMRGYGEDQFGLLTQSLAKKIVESSSPRIFARESPFALSSFAGAVTPKFLPESTHGAPWDTELETTFGYDWINMQQVFLTSIIMIEKMFKKYFRCLSLPGYSLNLSIHTPPSHADPFDKPYGEAVATISSNLTNETANFLFRIYPNLKNEDYWTMAGMLKIKRRQSRNFFVEPERKFRNRFENWSEFFKTQWSRISGPGASMMKSLSPFFDESVLFPLGIENGHAALSVDAKVLMKLFFSTDPSTIQFVRDIFGPRKREFYFDFETAQKLIRTSSIEFTDSTGLVSYVMPRNGSLLDVVQHMFGETEYRLRDLVEPEETLYIGSFTIKQILSFGKEDFKTDVRFSEISRKMQKPEYLYSCTSQIPAKQCPYMSLRKPNIPFWKRVMRVRDTYIAFIGSSAVYLPGNQTKHDLVMEHLGPHARPFVSKETGSFVVFEVYSRVKGFGPGSQQGMFYMMLAQDPNTLI